MSHFFIMMRSLLAVVLLVGLAAADVPCLPTNRTDAYTVNGASTTTSLCFKPCTSACSAPDSSQATASVMDGAISYFGGGKVFPAGTYTIQNQGGCMRFAGNQGWATDAQPTNHYVLVINGVDNIEMPGVKGYNQPPGCPNPTVQEGNAYGGWGFCNDAAGFQRCSDRNAATPPVSFTISAPSTLGFRLTDFPYSDNVAGLNGKSPSWSLSGAGCQ